MNSTKKRRGHNEGSIYKRKDGRWVAAMTIEGGKRKEFSGKTREEVRQKLAKAHYERQQLGVSPTTGSAERQTLKQYLTSWLETVMPPVLEESTWRQHHYLITQHITPTLGSTRLLQLSAQQVQRLYAAKLGESLSTTTVHHLHSTLHRALEQAVRLGLVVRNITDLVDAPRFAETELHVLSAEEARILLDVATGERLEALYVLALATGMRQSELLGLRWADVDLDAVPTPTLQVRYQLKRENGKLTFCAPKTRRSRRQIALAAPAAEALRRHRASQAEQRLRQGSAWHDHDLVFSSSIGTPLLARNVVRGFKALLEKGALPDVRFHDLRHTCATLLLGARVNPKVVSEMLGHASVAITLDVYSHVLPNMQQDAAAAMGELLVG